MNPQDEHTQDLIERALEQSIEALDLIATDDKLNEHLRATQELCHRALIELRGFGHDLKKEEWQGGK